MRKYLVILFLLSFSSLSAGKLEKGYEAMGIYNYFEARKIFYKCLKKQPCGAAFGLATIYSRNDNPFYNLDSAHKYISLSEKNYKSAVANKKTSARLAKLKITSLSITDLREAIYLKAFEAAEKTHSIEALNRYITAYPDAVQKKQAVAMRNALALEQAKKSDTWQSYQEFM